MKLFYILSLLNIEQNLIHYNTAKKELDESVSGEEFHSKIRFPQSIKHD